MWQLGFGIDLLQTIVGCYGGLLFLWWWYVLGRASTVYAMVMVVFFGFAVQNAVNLYLRHCLLFNPEGCSGQMEGFLFNVKDVLTFSGLIILVVSMTIRAARTVQTIRNLSDQGRRIDDV